MRLFSYKMTDDVGFAPNPFGGVLTLATCKPKMRQTKQVGDWILGWSSRELNGDPPGQERLVYGMQVEGKLTFAEYWNDKRFQVKKPSSASGRVSSVGDNIYEPNPDGTLYNFRGTHFHKDVSSQDRDLAGEYVLYRSRFYYFGRDPISLPQTINIAVPKGPSAYGSRTHNEADAISFIDFISQFKLGVSAPRHGWKENDDSWYEIKCN